jgi:predicted DNA binding protein
MSIVVEFSTAVERFELGRLIAESDGPQAELERLIPTEDGVIPYVWVTGSETELDELAESLTDSEKVASVESLDSLAVDGTGKQQQLFRIEWILPKLDIIRGIVDAEGIVLEGHSVDSHWLLRFRFPDHEHVAEFYQYLTDEQITEFRIECIYELQSRSERERGNRFDLTPEQREAITLAARKGYFETPRAVTLSELGSELGISEQAFSQRLRAATEDDVPRERDALRG